jgi:PhnB protein
MVNPVPDGYPVVTPYLCVNGAADAIDFYKDIFGAQERMRMPQPDGTIGHAELSIRDSVVMLSDEFPDMGVISPKSLGGTPVTLNVYVDNVDDVVDRAVAKGATLLQPIENRFYGDRSGQIVDPWGHKWSVATHVEDVPPDEMERRAAEFMGEGSAES